MKPYEFWNSTYREINIYTQSNICHIIDDLRQEIKLQEAVTDKLIMADTMSNKKPKIISIQEKFKNLFPQKEKKAVSPEEITRRMRQIMKSENKSNNVK